MHNSDNNILNYEALAHSILIMWNIYGIKHSGKISPLEFKNEKTKILELR